MKNAERIAERVAKRVIGWAPEPGTPPVAVRDIKLMVVPKGAGFAVVASVDGQLMRYTASQEFATVEYAENHIGKVVRKMLGDL